MLKQLNILFFCFGSYLIAVNPELSIVLTVYNKEHQIQKLLEGIITNTQSPFELVMVYDGCTDNSEKIAKQFLSKKKGNLQHIVTVYTPDVNETKANNAGMKACHGKYIILLQDDMYMTDKGWEKILLKPLKQYDDVFAVSGRWAASYFPFSSDPKMQKYQNASGGSKNMFMVRDVICRGPVAFDAHAMKQLGYFDETYAPLYLDDHDLCVRAYQQLKKVCGVICQRAVQLKRTINGPKKMSTGEYFGDIVKRNRLIFWQRYKQYFDGKNHNENRVIT